MASLPGSASLNLPKIALALSPKDGSDSSVYRYLHHSTCHNHRLQPSCKHDAITSNKAVCKARRSFAAHFRLANQRRCHLQLS